MIIETKYEIMQSVIICALGAGVPAKVIEITQTRGSLLYRIQYWLDGDLKYVYLTEDEIAKV